MMTCSPVAGRGGEWTITLRNREEYSLIFSRRGYIQHINNKAQFYFRRDVKFKAKKGTD